MSTSEAKTIQREARPTIQIVSHGPSCLDGVMAAAAVARFYTGERVQTTLAANQDSDRVLSAIRSRAAGGPDELWITDLSWTSTATGAHLSELARDGTRIYWIDHHRTAVGRADSPEFQVPFKGRVLSERYSAARLTFNYLRRKAKTLDSDAKDSFETFARFAAIADDHDRWVHAIPESSDWALAVQTLGGMESYRDVLRMREPAMTRRMRTALEEGQAAMKRSLEIAHTTCIDKPLHNGLTVRAACCFGYSSEVAAQLYAGRSRTVVALFDLRSQGVSLRRSVDCEVDLSALARTFGGGGHAAAAGFAQIDIARAPAIRLTEMLGTKLEEDSSQAG
jgi:oligoribonuclease NrnB/cAMP/cGMP phosphodiesterase (DHH superfamily)